jgi:uncharacterized protein
MSGNGEHMITVTGFGTAAGSPDVAEISIGVEAQRSSVKEARQAAAGSMNAVLSAIKKVGVAEKDIKTSDVHLRPLYDYSGKEQRLTGYVFGNTVMVTLRDLDLVSVVIDETAAAGATAVQGISFRVNDPSRLQSEARKQAMSDARARAEALAGLAGIRILGVASIMESVEEPPRPMMAYAARGVADATPIEPGTTEIRVNVTVSYLIGPG